MWSSSPAIRTDAHQESLRRTDTIERRPTTGPPRFRGIHVTVYTSLVRTTQRGPTSCTWKESPHTHRRAQKIANASRQYRWSSTQTKEQTLHMERVTTHTQARPKNLCTPAVNIAGQAHKQRSKRTCTHETEAHIAEESHTNS